MVVLNALIGADGHIKQLNAVSGPEVLKSAAMDAVRKWIYQPFLLNSEAREVATPITVRFSGDSAPEIVPNAPTQRMEPTPAYQLPAPESGRARISSAVIMTRLKTRVEPVYPANLNVGSAVVLRLLIGKEGQVSEVTGVAGPEALRGPAIDAVRQWKFEPYLLNGEPAEIETVVTLHPGR